MPPRTTAAPWAALLLTLPLVGCAPAQEFLDRAAPGVDALVPLDPDRVDRDDPFAGSPAEDYGEGFPVPDAEAVGPYTSEQVEYAYAHTQRLLEAVYLNQDAVFGEDNSELMGLLTGQSLEWYMDNLTNEDFELNSRHVPFNLTPGTAEPIGDQVRVDGWMRAEAARDEQGWDYLSVVTEYTIVHPVARPGRPASTRLVTSHLGEVGYYDTGVEELEAAPMWYRAVAPVHCVEEYTFTPSYDDEMPKGDRPGGVIEDAYDLETTREMDGCGAVGDT
ncbi:hypothetical protein [Nocardiopsis sp. NPDC006938]|uniref:hypothetical protein n=1 Tax=Nocardiopsis sp. NPDC006938 TaxID=3364337 RepID=UPI0036CB7410